ncbi:jumonji domain-containing 5 [Melanomma pulvis-pyrius CBS 109.77]|uniref:Jumonji domain-containing 5 n=1 Tax=Melanomma pulvis-pyrius CBS 109.77 TaxID=1314802 RepID=A0A6A6XWR3_9PLEO|nr:jumonji domain-containing 5 [Melanomma pulvis-pyrius CBS 109.77]
MVGADAPSLAEMVQLTRNSLTTSSQDDEIHECGRPALEILEGNPDMCIQLAYQKLHDVPYKEVKTCWRRLYTDAVLWKVLGFLEGVEDDGEVGKGVGMGRAKEGGFEDDWIAETVKSLDMALILTAAPRREELIELIFSALQALVSEQEQEQAFAHPSKRRKLTSTSRPTQAPRIPEIFPSAISSPKLYAPIPRLANLSLSAFQARISALETQIPIIITGAIDHWPALDERAWNRPKYLLERTLGGRRLVPVEIGRSYTDQGWGQKILSFGEFMGEYMGGVEEVADSRVDVESKSEDSIPLRQSAHRSQNSPSNAPNPTPKTDPPQTGYLAQHDLFAQIPSLRSDICIPDYCYTTPPPPSSFTKTNTKAVPKLEDPLLNAWFGPVGTISPLHTDPYHNILAQVVGSKYVRLYSPEQGKSLCPRGMDEMGVDMSNTSTIDLDGFFDVFPELSPWGGATGDGGAVGGDEERRRTFEERYPGFRAAPFVEGVLGPGDCFATGTFIELYETTSRTVMGL